mgnify:FL=1
MYPSIRSIAPAFLSAGLLFGCASTPPYSPEAFSPAPLEGVEPTPRVGTFVVVLDSSDSMNEIYKDRVKHHYARDVISHMNQTLPTYDFQAGMVVFGTGRCMDREDARLVYGMTRYQRSELESALNAVDCASGMTPMSRGIDASEQALVAGSDEIALIIVSDFEVVNSSYAVKSAEKMKSVYGDRLCIYPVQINGTTGGSKLMGKLTKASGCGFTVDADAIESPDAMARYVKRVFMTEILDSDGDGVPDDIDQCPGTPPGVRVNAVGCWVLADDNVLFEVDRTEIRDTTMLDEAIEILIANPEITGEIQGHTDNTGPAEYNMGLSLRRAEAVFDYMVQGGVAAERMRVEGYGEERPIASNDTAEGRAQNRRVELHPDR